ESLYRISTALTVLHWSRLSDQIGRKPVLMIAVAAIAIFMSFLGLSRTFSGLVVRLFFVGALSENTGVVDSVVGEITDSTNRAGGAAWGMVSWSIGGSVGALIGGNLANPSSRFPSVFKGDFWKQYPYFLPCFVVGIIGVVSFFCVFFFFEETVVKPSPLSTLEIITEEYSISSSDLDETYSVQQLLAYPPVVISVMNSVSLGFLFTCEGALVPLFFSMPSEIGGVGFDPVHIGYILGGYRAFMVFFVVTCCPWIIRRCGERFAFILAIYSCMSLWIVMPIINLCARSFGISTFVWVGVVFIALPLSIMEMGAICAFIYVTAAAPTRKSLGAMNGIVWTVAAITQAVAPTTATSLFSFSAKSNLFWGYAVYAVLFTLSCFSVLLALKLPNNTRPVWEVEDDKVDT
ncbi:hypothetical protein AX17_002632, partial [Amanita inopinata Kibby_2008]